MTLLEFSREVWRHKSLQAVCCALLFADPVFSWFVLWQRRTYRFFCSRITSHLKNQFDVAFVKLLKKVMNYDEWEVSWLQAVAMSGGVDRLRWNRVYDQCLKSVRREQYFLARPILILSSQTSLWELLLQVVLHGVDCAAEARISRTLFAHWLFTVIDIVFVKLKCN